MVLFDIIGEYEVLDIFKCLSRKQLVTFAISARCFAQLSASAAIHSVHLVDNFRDAVKLSDAYREEDKQMFLALQNALQYEEIRSHYRIVDQFYQWKRARHPHPDELPFIRQCFPLMSGGLCIETENYKVERGWHLEVASKLDFFQGACTEIIFDWGCFGQHWHRMLTHPTVLAARKLAIYHHVQMPNSADLVNWLWHLSRSANNGNANKGDWVGGGEGPGPRELTFRLLHVDEFIENITGILKQKFESSLENNAMPLPNFMLRFTHDDYGNSPMRQFSIKSIQKIVDNGKNIVAKFEFINCPADNSSHPTNHCWEIRQFYGEIEEAAGDTNIIEQRKTGGPVILMLNYNQEMDLSDSDMDDMEEEEENMEEEIEDDGNQQQQQEWLGEDD